MSELFRTPPPGHIAKDGSRLETPEEEYARLEREATSLRQQVGLPHLHGWKWYPWAAAFRDSTNPITLLCAANQISKSSTQIRKCIKWATDQELWPKLWAQKPIQFWYLYPTRAQVAAEFETKWKLFLPVGEMKDDPYYGWRVEKARGDVIAIHFNSGVHVYFKTYSQDVQALQTGTCEAIFCDEELPVELFDELMLRISASDGYFHMVFTATIGQDFWRCAMEPDEGDVEELPQAFKQTVSLYDALVYDDGSESHWTLEKIKRVEARCSTPNEILKRVYGKFIVIKGRKYEQFDLKRHFKPKHPVPKHWLIYGGADIGSGGGKAHKSALCYVAVRPDFRAGRVFLGWRGDNIQTTSGDVVEKHIEFKKQHNLTITAQHYDWAAADFGEIATRMGEPFERADKSHTLGEDVINTLFKHNMMYLYEDPEIRKLGTELATLKKETAKNKAHDDFADAFRYAVTKIPWDWTFITGTPLIDEEDEKPEMNTHQREIYERRKAFMKDDEAEKHRVEDEFNEWNEAYGNS